MRGIFSNVNDVNIFLMLFPRMSSIALLVSDQCREYEYGWLLCFPLRILRIRAALHICISPHALTMAQLFPPPS